jgi:hypothetical protein
MLFVGTKHYSIACVVRCLKGKEVAHTQSTLLAFHPEEQAAWFFA